MNNLKYYITHLKYTINTQKFVLTFILILFLNIYGVVFLGDSSGFFSAIYSIAANNILNVFRILICILNSNTIYNYMENNQFYSIRCGDKKIYNNDIIKNLIFINGFILFIDLLIGLIGLLIKYNGNYDIGNYYFYGISNIIYFIAFCFRKLAYINLLVIIFIYMKKLIGKIAVNIILFIFVAIMITYYYSDALIDSFKNIRLFIGYYFGLYQYASFALELACSLFIGMVLTIIAFTFYKLIIKYNK